MLVTNLSHFWQLPYFPCRNQGDTCFLSLHPPPNCFPLPCSCLPTCFEWLRCICPPPPPKHTHTHTHTHTFIDGQSCWPESLPRLFCKQEHSLRRSELAVSPLLLLHLYLIPSGRGPQISPCDPHEERPKWASWEVSEMLGKLEVHLGLSFSPWGNHRPRGGPLGAVLRWPRGGATSSKWNFSYPSNVVLLHLCGPGWGLSLTSCLHPGFWDFHSGVSSLDSC